MDHNYRTLRGYRQVENPDISYAMEDYLEMIYRQIKKEKYIRVNQLAQLLNVKPSSASKMVMKLKDKGMLEFEPYGIIQLSENGEKYGAYLYQRHDILNRFFCRINGTESELELVEKIEHYFDERTVSNIKKQLE